MNRMCLFDVGFFKAGNIFLPYIVFASESANSVNPY